MTASRELFWHRNEVGVGKHDYFGRAKGTVSVISPDRYRSVVDRTGARIIRLRLDRRRHRYRDRPAPLRSNRNARQEPHRK